MVKFNIRRFDLHEGGQPHLESFDVPFVKGMRILDALRWIKGNTDSSLSFRYECKKATCGSCAVVVNGESVLACKTAVEPDKEYTIEPLKGLPVIKDLVVELSGIYEKLDSVKPYLACSDTWNGNLTKEEVEATRELRKCIECYVCVSENGGDCNVMSLVKLARFDADVRDTEDRHETALSQGLLPCWNLEKCTKLCPQGIDIKKAVERLGKKKKGKVSA